MIAQTWTDVLAGSLQNLWIGFVSFVPDFVIALIVLVVGIVVAAGLGALVEKIFDTVRFDAFLEKLGLKPYFERAGLKLRGAYFLGRFVFWFIALAFLLAVSSALGLDALSVFLASILNYLPKVIAAALVMLAATVLANFLRHIVVASVRGAKLHAAKFLGSFVWWVIVVFGLLTALTELNVATEIIQSVVMGFIAMLALAGGLAFGLGGKDYANYLVNKLREHHE